MGWWLLFQTITIMKHLGFFFTLLVLSVFRKKNESSRALFASFSFQWIERRGRKRTILLKVFFLTRVTNIAFLNFFFWKIGQKNTHTGRKNKQMLFFYKYTPCFELCRREMAVRKRREATIREVTDFVSADRLRHTESCMHRQCLRCLHYLKEFLSFCDVSYYSSWWIYDVGYIGKVV